MGKKKKKIEEQREQIGNLELKVKSVEQLVNQDKKSCEELKSQKQKNQEKSNSLRAEINDCKTEKARNDVDIKTLEME